MPYTDRPGQMLDGLDEAVIGLKAGEYRDVHDPAGRRRAQGQGRRRHRHRQRRQGAAPPRARRGVRPDRVRVRHHRRAARRPPRPRHARQAHGAGQRGTRPRARRDRRPDRRPAARLARRRGARSPAASRSTQQLAFAGMSMQTYLEDESQTADEFEADLEQRVRDSIIAQFVLDQMVADGEFGIDDTELCAAHHAARPAVRRGPELLRPAHHGAQPRARDGERGAARQGARLAGRVGHGQGRVRQRHGALHACAPTAPSPPTRSWPTRRRPRPRVLPPPSPNRQLRLRPSLRKRTKPTRMRRTQRVLRADVRPGRVGRRAERVRRIETSSAIGLGRAWTLTGSRYAERLRRAHSTWPAVRSLRSLRRSQ